MAMSRILALLLGQVCQRVALGSDGADECPCITSSSPDFADFQAAVTSINRGSGYGLEGCKTYDAGIHDATVSCKNNESHYCELPWCYVDMNLCPQDKALCEAAGGVIGSSISAHCRTRENTASAFLQDLKGHYSYQTCGALDVYNASLETSMFKGVAGRVLKVAVEAFEPYVIERKNIGGEVEYGGTTYDFFVQILKLFKPRLTLLEIPGWATDESMEIWPDNSYTACVHDVAIGNFDLCVADLWVTPERAKLCTFLPSIRQDFFYLAVPKLDRVLTVWERLQRPFLPFSADGWLLVAAFLFAFAVVLWLDKVYALNVQRKKSEPTQPTKPSLHRKSTRLVHAEEICQMQYLAKFQFEIVEGFVSGSLSPELNNISDPGQHFYRRFFNLAFTFFVLVITASYTASLASILVQEPEAKGTYQDINEALRKNAQICVPDTVFETFKKMYPNGKKNFVKVDTLNKLMDGYWEKNCTAIVVTDEFLKVMHSGKRMEEDCPNGTSTVNKSKSCAQERNDCNLMRVGDVLYSLPVSLPVSDALARSLSWAVINAQVGGWWDYMKLMNAETFPEPKCDAMAEPKDPGMSLDDLLGTFLVASFTVAVGMGIIMFPGNCIFEKGANVAKSLSRTLSFKGQIDTE